MNKEPLAGYRYSDKYGSVHETEVIKAKRFVFWYRLIWRIIWVVAIGFALANMPIEILIGTLCVIAFAGFVGATIWSLERADKSNRILKSAKQIGVRKDV